MRFSDVRLAELVQILATKFPEGCDVEAFRAAAYPRADDTRGARRVLSEMCKLTLVESHGATYRLSAAGWEAYRSPRSTNGAHDELEGEADEQPSESEQIELEYIESARLAGDYVPTVPHGSPSRAADGSAWIQGPDNVWWLCPPGRTPRAQVGGWFFQVRAGRVVGLRVDRWGRELGDGGQVLGEAFPQPQAQQAPIGQWHTGPDGRQWFWDGGRGFWTLDGYGRAVPA